MNESFIVNAESADPIVEFKVGGDQATVIITDNDSKKIYYLLVYHATCNYAQTMLICIHVLMTLTATELYT